MFPALLAWPSMVIVRGYVPVAVPAGITILACASPTNPRLRPAKSTCADAEPIVAATVAVDCKSGDAGVANPSVIVPLTGPEPVKYAMTTLPAAAGLPG